MKLGLYGDSFVGSKNLSSWTNLLRVDYDYDVTNYGFPGTGLDFSYYHFLKTHADHEKIVFVAANIYRGTIFSKIENYGVSLYDNINQLEIQGVYGLYNGYDTMSEILTGNKFSSDANRYLNNKFVEWAEYGYGNEILKYNAMTSHIKMLRPDVHFVYAFNNFDDRAFWNISQLDMVKFKTERETNNRPNHMSYKQNKQVANYMHQWINGEIDFNDTLSSNDIQKYYYTSDTFEESGLVL